MMIFRKACSITHCNPPLSLLYLLSLFLSLYPLSPLSSFFLPLPLPFFFFFSFSLSPLSLSPLYLLSSPLFLSSSFSLSTYIHKRKQFYFCLHYRSKNIRRDQNQNKSFFANTSLHNSRAIIRQREFSFPLPSENSSSMFLW